MSLELDENIMLADGLESAFVGIVDMFGGKSVACYDYEKVIGILMNRDGMDRDEAEEFFDFNIIGAYVGEFTPVYIRLGELS